MLYAAIWRALPGPLVLRMLLATLLVLLVVAVCFLWIFPRVAPVMPFNDNTVDPSASHATTVNHPVAHGPAAAHGARR